MGCIVPKMCWCDTWMLPYHLHQLWGDIMAFVFRPFTSQSWVSLGLSMQSPYWHSIFFVLSPLFINTPKCHLHLWDLLFWGVSSFYSLWMGMFTFLSSLFLMLCKLFVFFGDFHVWGPSNIVKFYHAEGCWSKKWDKISPVVYKCSQISSSFVWK